MIPKISEGDAQVKFNSTNEDDYIKTIINSANDLYQLPASVQKLIFELWTSNQKL